PAAASRVCSSARATGSSTSTSWWSPTTPAPSCTCATRRSTRSPAAESSAHASELVPVARSVLDVAGRVAGDVGRVRNTLAHASRYADRDRAGGDLHAVGHKCGGPAAAPRLHERTVQHDGPGPDQRTVLDHTALEMGQVPDHAVVADERVELLGAVDDGAVLDRRTGPDDDLAVVAAQDRLRPDRALVADGDITDHGGFGVHEGGRGDLRRRRANGIDGHAGTVAGCSAQTCWPHMPRAPIATGPRSSSASASPGSSPRSSTTSPGSRRSTASPRPTTTSRARGRTASTTCW